ncbi:MAG: PD-(D/E)XK nuclease family protein [Pirellulales bacterium]
MPIERRWIDWQRPALAAAADYLVEVGSRAKRLDLGGVIVAVTGSGAGRRLVEILVERAESAGLPLVPPHVVTVGKLPELLYEARQPFADDTVQQLAWVDVLKSLGRDKLAPLVPRPPDDDDLFGWLALGQMLAHLHRELAGDALDFADVAEQGARLPAFHETGRWRLLAEIQQAYLRVLDTHGLWDLQTARLFAIEHGECRTDKRIVLVGTVDLNRAQRAMLDQVADRVTALVFAPPDLADRFDEHGCLLPDKWQEPPATLASEQIEVADGPADQAQAVAEALASLDGRYAAAEITIGVADETVVPYIEQRLAQCGLRARHGAGIPVSRSGPYCLLARLADYVESGRFAAFASLVRHPGVAGWLARRGFEPGRLTRIDKYYNQHLPSRLDGNWTEGGLAGAVRRVYSAMDGLTAGFRGAPRALSDWVEKILGALVEVYAHAPLDRDCPADRMVLAACDRIHDALEACAAVPARLAPAMAGGDALRLALRTLESEALPPPADQQAIELAGWLELAMDDAPALIVTGFNEGIVPSARNGDLFLPNELRRKLKLEDNHRRFARDAYALAVLAASRQYLRVIAGRRTADNEPLTPSRLSFGADPQTTARRALSLFSPPRPRRAAAPGGLRPGRAQSGFAVPRPLPLAAPGTAMRVTEFCNYLACPYRYYLRHRLRLEALDDRAVELDPGGFGSLIHDVLKVFGQGPAAGSTSAAEINRELGRVLDEIAAGRFAGETLPAVGIQVEQARRRLAAFAAWQADWRRDG